MKPDPEAGADHRTERGNRRRSLRLVVLLIAASIVVVGALTLLDVSRAVREVRAGRAAFAGLVREGLVSDGGLQAHARTGVGSFARAERVAHDSPWIGALARVPIVGRSARWLRATTQTAASLSRRAAESIGRVEPSLASIGDPAQRLAFLALLEKEFGELRRSLEAVRLPDAGFLPPANAAGREVEADLARVRDSLARGVVAARGLRSFLAGPSNYLVLAGNNAEMRAGGMVLQAGILHARDAAVAAGAFRTTAELALREPVPLPAQLDALYGWLDPGREWRNVGSSPNFPAIAPIYAAMAKRSGLRTVDGVLQLDVIGLRELLRVVGPVQLGSTRFDPANVERLLLHDLYGTFATRQEERRAEFSRLATAIFAALNDRPWRPADLARALSTAGGGRHLLVWSPHAVHQAAWRALQVDGALPEDGFLLTVQNHTGNKVDWFLRPRVTMDVSSAPGGRRRIRARITIANPAPAGPASYVLGDGSLVPAGGYRALVAVYLPERATDVELPGETVNLVGPDGPMRVIGTRVDILAGETAAIELAFSLPGDVRSLVLLPSARVRPVPVVVGGRRFDDAVRRTIAL